MKNSFTETKKSKSRSAFARATDKAPTAPFDWWLFTIVLVILAVGLVMVLSASGIVAEQVNGDKYYFFKRQLLFAARMAVQIAVSGPVLFLVAAVDHPVALCSGHQWR